MAGFARLNLAGLAVLGGVSAFRFQLPFFQDQAPLVDAGVNTNTNTNIKPLIDSEALQASISSDNLLARAKELYKIAKLGEDEYNHPTRVIGSEGELATLHLHPHSAIRHEA